MAEYPGLCFWGEARFSGSGFQDHFSGQHAVRTCYSDYIIARLGTDNLGTDKLKGQL